MFVYRRRVQFAETDLAGIVHFANYFRYLEEAEHALWRAAGLTIAAAGETTGWPRISASFEFKAPLRFEDEFEVHVRLAEVNDRTLRYDHTVVRGDTLIGRGSITTAHVSKAPGEPMKAVKLPAGVAARLRAACDAAGV